MRAADRAALDHLPPAVVLSVLRAEKMRRDFGAFARAAWPTLEPRPLVWSWHMDAVCEHLQAVTEGQIKRLAICIPPGMSKSTLVSVLWPAWHWLHKPAWRWLVAGAVEKVVLRDAVKHHDICASEWYRDTFGIEWDWSADEDAKSYFVTTAGGARMTATTRQRIQGSNADGLIVDDPLDARDAAPTREALAEHVDWFDHQAMMRLRSPDAPVVLIMQRLHEADLAGVLLARGGWEALVLPAVADEEPSRCSYPAGTTTRDTRAVGELLCSRMTEASIAEQRVALGARGFDAQLQQRPAPAEGSIFKKSWLRFWDEATLPPSFDFKVLSVDTVKREGRANDFVAGQVWGVKGALCYLLEQWRARQDVPDTIREILAVCARHQIRAVLVENVHGGKQIIATLAARIPNLKPVDPHTSKEARAHAVTPRWEAGQVYLPAPYVTPWVERIFLPELLGFPVAQHDDQVDAMTQALAWIDAHPSAMPFIGRLGSPRR